MKVRNTKGIANPQFKTSGLQIRWNRGGTIISTFWFVFGGRELVFHYGETMGKLIKDGINPGYPVYQPFK